MSVCVCVNYVKIHYIAACVVDLEFVLDFGNGILEIHFFFVDGQSTVHP